MYSPTDVIYTDLALTKSTVHTNIQAVKQAIEALIQTKRGDRFFNPTIYSTFEDIIFNLNTNTLKDYYIALIEDEIKRIDPRIDTARVITDDKLSSPHSVVFDVYIVLVDGEEIINTLQVTK